MNMYLIVNFCVGLCVSKLNEGYEVLKNSTILEQFGLVQVRISEKFDTPERSNYSKIQTYNMCNITYIYIHILVLV
jgi:hypothetical protein